MAGGDEHGGKGDMFKAQEYQLYRRRLSSEMAGNTSLMFRGCSEVELR